jgi:hypothetical protein
MFTTTSTEKGTISISDELILTIVTTMAKNLTNMNLKDIQMSTVNNNCIFDVYYQTTFKPTFISDLTFLNTQLTKLIKRNLNINSLILKIYLEN